MKVIAFYLPQFHEVKENNIWWGKGFTEWMNVKKAKPLFVGHDQPRIPYEENYYDLSEVETLQWQQGLAKQYGVHGFCFYHYWFEDGKKLLEKPAEILLANTDIALNFCFSWANEPWTRSWDGKHGEVIMPQSYGDKAEWKNHFDYLIPFFKDERYIKIEDKPIFVIYKPSSIPNLDDMLEYWHALAIQQGFKGIYFINTLRSKEKIIKNNFSACVEFEPAYSTSNLTNAELNKRRILRYSRLIINKVKKSTKPFNLPMDYDKMTQKSLVKEPIKEMKTIPGAFVEWDNTPRKGQMGTYYSGFNIDKFQKYLDEKMRKGKDVYNSEYIFINAWNEWAEGTYLEPDEKYGFDKLEVIKNIVEKNKWEV